MELLLDYQRKQAKASLFGDGEKQFANPAIGEVLEVSVARLIPLVQPINQRTWQPLGWEGWTVRIAIGRGFLLPEAGTFTLTYDAETTAPINFNANAATVEAALDALTTISAIGGVGVTGSNGYFRIEFTNPGERADITGNGSGLAPLSVIQNGVLIEGTVELREIQAIRIFQNPGAYAVLVEDSSPPGAFVQELQQGGGGNNHKIRITLLPETYDGQWTIHIGGVESTFISHNANVAEVTEKIGAMSSVAGEANLVVSKETENQWVVMFIGAKANTDMGEIDADGTALLVIPYRLGQLDLRTAAFQLLLAGATTATAVLEVEGIPPGGGPRKLLRRDITLDDSVINPETLVPPASVFENANIINGELAGIDELIGGANSLFVVPTINVPVGLIVFVNDATYGYGSWQLDDGNDANDIPDIFRPQDYASGTNEKVWRRRS